jgi:hypothetical protein
MIIGMTNANIIMSDSWVDRYQPTGTANYHYARDVFLTLCLVKGTEREDFVHALARRCYEIYAGMCDLLANPFVLMDIIEEGIHVEGLNTYQHPSCIFKSCIYIDIAQIMQCMHIDAHGALHIDKQHLRKIDSLSSV